MPKTSLEHLDGKRKYLRTDNQGNDYYVRIITSSEKLKKYVGEPKANWSELESTPNLWYLLGPIARRSVENVKKIHKGKKVISAMLVPDKTDEEKYANTTTSFQNMMDKFDEGVDGDAAIFVVENADGEPVSAIKIYIDREEKRADMKVRPNIGTFILLDGAGTANGYEGQGFLADVVDEMLLVMTDPERKLPEPFQFSVSMIGATIIDEKEGQSVETKYVMNSGLYAPMWQNRFLNTELQNRWIYPDDKQLGMSTIPLEEFLQQDGEDKKIDQNEIDVLIKNQEEHARSEGAKVRGLYFNGISKFHEENEIMIKEFRNKRGERTNSVYDEAKDKGWQEVPSPAPKSAHITLQEQQKAL